MAKLIINPTSASRREISLSGTALSIGRDPGNDLVLPDTLVSRRHAVVELRGAQVGFLPAEILARLPHREAMENARDRISREYLSVLMREFEGNVTRAAERAGVERESLHRLLKRYGVRSDEFKRG